MLEYFLSNACAVEASEEEYAFIVNSVFGLPFTVIVAFWFLIQLFLKYIKDIPFDTTSSSYVIPNPGVLEDLGFEVNDEDDFEFAFIGDDFVLGVDDLVLEDDELVLDLFEVGRKIVFKLHSRKYYS